MGVYNEYCLPHLINCTCGMPEIEKQRSIVVPQAYGRVLEVGMGSGLNLKHYDNEKVEMIWGLEPSIGMRRKAAVNLAASQIEVTWLDLPSESIPLDDHSVDTIVLTYTLCTIEDVDRALAEMRRVLKPTGQMVFSEHGEAPDEGVQRWQRRINPLWKKIAGGCNLNRQIPVLLKSGGFEIIELKQHYLKGPKVATYQYFGVAR